MKTPRRHIRPAFTLIELLVVIGIIAILVGLAGPGLTSAMLSGKITQATAHARQIALGLRTFAQDNEGAFPDGKDFATSNDAYRDLIPNYIDSEVVFTVGNSPVGKKADNVVEPKSRALERGENHWAYVSGLTTSSHSMWPLVVDHTDGSGHYTDLEASPGGTWRGTKGIIVRTDTSAAAIRLLGSGSKRYIPRFNDTQKNALEVRDYMGENVRLLEPEK
jgi:prepilin-type N-terminal cleavage/methylation domain-containing protein